MKKMPKVGDIVKPVRRMLDWGGGWVPGSMNRLVGKTATVRGVSNSHGGMVRLNVSRHDLWWFPIACLASNDLDLTKRVKLRGKGVLHSVKKVRNKARPFQADVTIGKRRLALHYLPDGTFYEGFDQPIDLVNA